MSVNNSVGVVKPWMRRTAGACGGVLLLGLAGGGCAVGSGAPDGWTYQNAHGVAFAHPKDWTALPASALPRGALGGAVWTRHGKRLAEVEVLYGTLRRPHPKGVKVRTAADFELGGKPAAQFGYVYGAHPHGPRLRVMDVTGHDAHGRPILLRVTGSSPPSRRTPLTGSPTASRSARSARATSSRREADRPKGLSGGSWLCHPGARGTARTATTRPHADIRRTNHGRSPTTGPRGGRTHDPPDTASR